MKSDTNGMSRSELMWVAKYHDRQAELCERHNEFMERKVNEFGLGSRKTNLFLRMNGIAVQQGTEWMKDPAIRPYLEAVR